MLTTSVLPDLIDIVISAARLELLPRFNHVERNEKADGSIVTEADIETQRFIQDALQQKWPDIGLLGEEMSADEQQALLSLNKPLWCLDPLDGTRNFATGIRHFAISLALLDQGQVRLGIVYDPFHDECFSALAGEGAWLNGKLLSHQPTGLSLQQTTALIDFKRLPNELSTRLVTERPYASQRSFGSAALDWCWLACGRCHVYVHGRSNIWDYAAGHLVFQQAGGYSTTLAGGEMFVNALTPRAAVGALDEDLFKEWTSWLGIPR
jgi:myo-inositol-1(or 4)-monophosphatase